DPCHRRDGLQADEPIHEEVPVTDHRPNGTAKIEIRQLSVGYGGRQVVRGVDLAIPATSIYAYCGQVMIEPGTRATDRVRGWSGQQDDRATDDPDHLMLPSSLCSRSLPSSTISPSTWAPSPSIDKKLIVLRMEALPLPAGPIQQSGRPARP